MNGCVCCSCSCSYLAAAAATAAAVVVYILVVCMCYAPYTLCIYNIWCESHDVYNSLCLLRQRNVSSGSLGSHAHYGGESKISRVCDVVPIVYCVYVNVDVWCGELFLLLNPKLFSPDVELILDASQPPK